MLQRFAPPGGQPPQEPQHRGFWREVVRNRNAYLFIAPFYLLFTCFMLFPIVFSLYLSFFRWNGITAMQPVGLAQYRDALTDHGLLNALRNTVVYALLTVTLSTAFGLFFALFLNSVRIFKRFYRGVFFIPSIVSLVVVSLIWKLMLNSEVGLVNEMIHGAGTWLASANHTQPDWARQPWRFLDNPNPLVPLLTLVVVNLWAVVGYNTVIFLAGLQGIPANLYDVSRIDGATPLQNLWHITLPLLRPTTFFVVLLTTIDALQVFVLPQVMNRDAESTMTIVYYLFRNAFEFYRMGYASAIAYLLFALTVLLSLVIRAAFGEDTRWTSTD